MIHFLRLTVQNFLSIGNVNQEVELDLDGLTLILGENQDVGGTNSRNGVGKTAILQAICYALFGRPLTKIKLDNLVNAINGKAMLVALDFEINGKPFRIERGRKPAVFRFYRDGVLQRDQNEAQGESRQTQAEIERVLGMGFLIFRHIIGLSTATTPFLREEAAVQREVIEELFGITQLSQRADSLKKRIDVTKERTRVAEATIKANVEANGRIAQAISRAKDEAAGWQASQDRRVAQLTQKLEALHAINVERELAVFDQIERWHQQSFEIEAQRQLHEQQLQLLRNETTSLKAEIARYEREARDLDDGQIARLAAQAQTYMSESKRDITAQTGRLRAEITRRQQEIGLQYEEQDRLAGDLAVVLRQIDEPDQHVCSTCGQGLTGTEHLASVLQNLDRQRAQLTAGMSRCRIQAAEIAQAVTETEAEIATLTDENERYRAEMRDKAVSLTLEVDAAKDRQAQRQAHLVEQLDGLRNRLVEREHALTSLHAQRDGLPVLGPLPVSSFENRDAVWQVRQEREALMQHVESEIERANPHTAKIEALQTTLIDIDYEPINRLTNEFKHQTFLLKLLTSKDSFIRKRLIDQSLSFQNRRLNHYLDRLGLPHEVAFQPDLSVEISLLGREFDFEQLSRGESNRVILAMAFSFRDVYEDMNAPVSLLFVDEMLDQGTDGAGVEAALGILTSMASTRQKSVFLISHREELRDRIDHVLTVRKENQFTSITA